MADGKGAIVATAFGCQRILLQEGPVNMTLSRTAIHSHLDSESGLTNLTHLFHVGV